MSYSRWGLPAAATAASYASCIAWDALLEPWPAAATAKSSTAPASPQTQRDIAAGSLDPMPSARKSDGSRGWSAMAVLPGCGRHPAPSGACAAPALMLTPLQVDDASPSGCTCITHPGRRAQLITPLHRPPLVLLPRQPEPAPPGRPPAWRTARSRLPRGTPMTRTPALARTWCRVAGSPAAGEGQTSWNFSWHQALCRPAEFPQHQQHLPSTRSTPFQPADLQPRGREVVLELVPLLPLEEVLGGQQLHAERWSWAVEH